MKPVTRYTLATVTLLLTSCGQEEGKGTPADQGEQSAAVQAVTPSPAADTPAPQPEPEPEVEPAAESSDEPAVLPEPAPSPEPTPTPETDASGESDPEPMPTPEAIDPGESDPEPTPAPETDAPGEVEPEPAPAPETDAPGEVEPEPTPAPEAIDPGESDPEPTPAPEAIDAGESDPEPTPAPEAIDAAESDPEPTPASETADPVESDPEPTILAGGDLAPENLGEKTVVFNYESSQYKYSEDGEDVSGWQSYQNAKKNVKSCAEVFIIVGLNPEATRHILSPNTTANGDKYVYRKTGPNTGTLDVSRSNSDRTYTITFTSPTTGTATEEIFVGSMQGNVRNIRFVIPGPETADPGESDPEPTPGSETADLGESDPEPTAAPETADPVESNPDPTTSAGGDLAPENLVGKTAVFNYESSQYKYSEDGENVSGWQSYQNAKKNVKSCAEAFIAVGLKPKATRNILPLNTPAKGGKYVYRKTGPNTGTIEVSSSNSARTYTITFTSPTTGTATEEIFVGSMQGNVRNIRFVIPNPETADPVESDPEPTPAPETADPVESDPEPTTSAGGDLAPENLVGKTAVFNYESSQYKYSEDGENVSGWQSYQNAKKNVKSCAEAFIAVGLKPKATRNILPLNTPAKGGKYVYRKTGPNTGTIEVSSSNSDRTYTITFTSPTTGTATEEIFVGSMQGNVRNIQVSIK